MDKPNELLLIEICLLLDFFLMFVRVKCDASMMIRGPLMAIFSIDTCGCVYICIVLVNNGVLKYISSKRVLTIEIL